MKQILTDVENSSQQEAAAILSSLLTGPDSGIINIRALISAAQQSEIKKHLTNADDLGIKYMFITKFTGQYWCMFLNHQVLTSPYARSLPFIQYPAQKLSKAQYALEINNAISHVPDAIIMQLTSDLKEVNDPNYKT